MNAGTFLRAQNTPLANSAASAVEEVSEIEETAEEINEVEETAEETNEVEETVEENDEVEETVEEAAEAETPAAEPEKAPADEASEVNVSIERTKARNTDTQIVSADLPQIEEIEDEVMPLANAPKAGWSLMNLIAVILTALIALGMVLRRTAGIFGFIPAIASVMIFALNENLSGNMIMTNSWTPVMIVILLAAAVMAVLTAKKARKQNV